MPPIDERIARLEQITRTLEHIVCGPPTLIEQSRAYTDSRADHKERNLQQLVLNIRERLEHDANVIREDLERETAKNDSRHESNDSRLRNLEKLAWGIMGVQMLLKLIPGDLIMKMFGGH